MVKIEHKGPILCLVKDCAGHIVWFRDHDRSIEGKCLSCGAHFTLLMTKFPPAQDIMPDSYEPA